MPPACEPRRSYRSSSPISIVTGWSSGSNKARACPRESGGQEGSLRHSLAHPYRDIARMVARRAQEGMDVSRSALVVSRLPRAAYECPPDASDGSPGSGACRHHQACRRSYPAALLCHSSSGAKDRYPRHPSSARSRDILPANIRSRGGFTTHSIPGAASPCSLPGNMPIVVLSWSLFRSPTGRSPAYLRG
jgi:hypothetical protein